MSNKAKLKFLTNYNLLKYVCEETLADKIFLNGEVIFDVSYTLKYFKSKGIKITRPY